MIKTESGENLYSKKEAAEYLGITEKLIENYSSSSQELRREKIRGRWYYRIDDLDKWIERWNFGTIELSEADYKECFKFAVMMAYSSNSRHGTGIRGQRSEVQMTDDFIFGILAEYGVKKFLKYKFDKDIVLDTEVHPEHITSQDFIGIISYGIQRECRIRTAVKASKMKSCWNVIDPLEYENRERCSEVYIFCRVSIPSDHLFRIFRDHEMLSEVIPLLNENENMKKIHPMEKVKIWVCGFNNHNEFSQVTEIPGQKFSDRRFVVSVSSMHNSEEDWRRFAERL